MKASQSKVYPELAFFDTPPEGRLAMKTFWRRTRRRPLFWLQTLAIGLFTGVVVPLSARTIVPLLRISGPRILTRAVASAILGTIVGVAVGLAFQYLWRRPVQRYLREQLIARGVPICLHCGYDLRGQTEPRCPECGREFAEALLRREDGGHDGGPP